MLPSFPAFQLFQPVHHAPRRRQLHTSYTTTVCSVRCVVPRRLNRRACDGPVRPSIVSQQSYLLLPQRVLSPAKKNKQWDLDESGANPRLRNMYILTTRLPQRTLIHHFVLVV